MAPELLGKIIVVRDGSAMLTGRIIETEAYTADDPASHSYRGRTPRNAVMFGPPGHLYVYLSYGIHRCANVVTGADGDGQAVLIRAIEPLEGVPEMLRRRGRKPIGDGPGKLCQALGIELSDNGTSFGGAGRVGIIDDGTAPPMEPATGPRVGITKAVDVAWRFVLVPRAGDQFRR